MKHASRLKSVVLACILAAVTAAARPAEGAAPLRYSVSWFGNTFGSASKWVQMDAEAMAVTPDGTCYLNTFWEEGGRNVGIYRSGDVIGNAGHTHGWGYEGGDAVAVNDRYLFIAQQVGNEGGGLKAPDTWPAKGRTWYGISRRLRDGSPAPFPGGEGGSGDTLRSCFLVVDDYPDGEDAGIRGMAADAGNLYVADASGKVIVVDPESMTRKAEWPVPRARRIAIAPDRTLWVLQSSSSGVPGSLLHFQPDGSALPGRITALSDPTALAIDASGRIYVGDNGPDQQIHIYSRDGDPLSNFGEKGGILSGVRGLVGPRRFNGIIGVGVDRAGNIYVCSRNSGVVLESYGPDGKLNWRLEGLEFVDCADWDPASPSDVFTKEEHFRLKYGAQAGKNWSYRGYTRDWIRYPEDPRAHVEFATAFVRRIEEKRIVFGTDMYADHLMIYRFDGKDEIAIPCGYLAQRHRSGKDAWPPHQPATGEWIWRDTNGNGRFDVGEFDSRPADAPPTWGWCVDSHGDIWQANDANTIRHFRCEGLDAHGSPVYRYAAVKTDAAPAPFTNLQRVQYEPAQDTMYLSGYSGVRANTHGNWKTVGKVICRYDHWGGARTLRWEIDPPFDEAQEKSHGAGTPVAMDVAGDYLFVVYLITAEIRVYDNRTAAYIGTMRPGPGLSGWVDLPYGIRAHRAADGSYSIFAEEDAKAKGLLYHWTP